MSELKLTCKIINQDREECGHLRGLESNRASETPVMTKRLTFHFRISYQTIISQRNPIRLEAGEELIKGIGLYRVRHSSGVRFTTYTLATSFQLTSAMAFLISSGVSSLFLIALRAFSSALSPIISPLLRM